MEYRTTTSGNVTVTQPMTPALDDLTVVVRQTDRTLRVSALAPLGGCETYPAQYVTVATLAAVDARRMVNQLVRMGYTHITW